MKGEVSMPGKFVLRTHMESLVDEQLVQTSSYIMEMLLSRQAGFQISHTIRSF